MNAPLERDGSRNRAWDRGVLSKLVSLAGARVVAQLIGLGWYMYAAREFDARDFGLLSTGLVLVVAIGALSDLGITRTVVRHVAAEPDSLRANLVRGLLLRSAAGALVGLAATLVIPIVQPDIPISIVATAALIAIASGATEVGYAVLRSVGLTGAEVALLVGERALFVVAGFVAVAQGAGPVGVLVVYGATNLMSAVLIAVRALRWPDGRGAPAGPMLDSEARHTAVSSTLVTIAPRISALVLVLVSIPAVVGTFSIAQKVPEALAVLGTAVLMPMLPMLRSALVEGKGTETIARAGRVTAAVTAAVVPVTLWLFVDAARVLDLLFDAGERPDAVTAMRILLVASVIWVVRTYGELILLAQERARRYVVAIGVGVGFNVLAGAVLVSSGGTSDAASAAAAAALGAEVIVIVVVFASLRSWVTAAVWRLFLPAGLLGLVALLASVGLRNWPLGYGVAVSAACALVGLVIVGRPLRDQRDVSPSAPTSDDADVGEDVDGHLVGDGIEAIEYLAGPADHL